MKMNVKYLLGAIFLVPVVTFAQTTQADCPPSTGAYFLQGSTWTSMDPSHSMGFKAKANTPGSLGGYDFGNHAR
jgi:hypothetical protein